MLNQSPLAVKSIPVCGLRPHPRNARRHSKAQIRKIADSIASFGFNCPILIDENNRILAGHGRLQAARLLGLEEVPTIRIDRLTEAQKRAFLIADNRLTEIGDWDQHQLAMELKELTADDLDFDLSAIGFETPEIDLMIESLDQADQGAESEPETLDLPLRDYPVSQPGDLWQLGRHRLLCANALAARSFDHLLAGEKAGMVFCDPPYNVPIEGHVCGLGDVHHDEFAMASGEMSEPEFTEFLAAALGNLARFSADGALHFICMDWRHAFELLSAARGVYTETKNLCVWAKTNAGMGSLYRSQHELVFVFKSGRAPHINNVALGRHGRHRTNVWTYPGVNTFGRDRLEILRLHPTVKPVALVMDAIKDCSRRNDLVLDAFMGSGTTMIAAERTGRRARGIELEPRYVDVAIRRWQGETGLPAIHAGSGRSFDEIAEATDGR